MFDLNYHPAFYTPIDRSQRALQLCRGGRGEWVKFRLRFWSIKYFALRERPVRRSHLLRSYRRSWPNFAHISKTFSRKYPENFEKWSKNGSRKIWGAKIFKNGSSRKRYLEVMGVPLKGQTRNSRFFDPIFGHFLTLLKKVAIFEK